MGIMIGNQKLAIPHQMLFLPPSYVHGAKQTWGKPISDVTSQEPRQGIVDLHSRSSEQLNWEQGAIFL